VIFGKCNEVFQIDALQTAEKQALCVKWQRIEFSFGLYFNLLLVLHMVDGYLQLYRRSPFAHQRTAITWDDFLNSA
jgi:hypothetical protein